MNTHDDRALLGGARKLRTWFGPDIDRVYGSFDGASLLRALQSVRPVINQPEAEELSRYLVQSRTRQALRRRIRARMLWLIAGLGMLGCSILLAGLLTVYDDRICCELESTGLTVLAFSFIGFLLWCLILPLILSLGKPHGFDELQVAFRWAAERPGQGSRGLPLGPLAGPSPGLAQAKYFIRYRFGGIILMLCGALVILFAVLASSWWAVAGVPLIPAGAYVHRWANGKHDVPGAARYLLARHVCAFEANEFGLFADAATQSAEVEGDLYKNRAYMDGATAVEHAMSGPLMHRPARFGKPSVHARVVFHGTRGLPREELEYRIYFARHNPDVAGAVRGRPRHRSQSRILWEIADDGVLACSLRG